MITGRIRYSEEKNGNKILLTREIYFCISQWVRHFIIKIAGKELIVSLNDIIKKKSGNFTAFFITMPNDSLWKTNFDS